MRRTKISIIVSLLFMAIGFAAITTTLVINGTISIGKNGFESDIIFTMAVAENGADATISRDGKSIIFNTNELKTLNQTSVLNYEVTNKNRQYDAQGTISCEMIDNDNLFNDYISVTANPSAFEILATEKLSGTITVRLEKSFVGTETSDVAEVEFKCTLNITGLDKDSEDSPIIPPTTEPINSITVISGTGESLGDEIAIGTEHFYVLSNDRTNVKMLAKYNLQVGNVYGKNTETNKYELTPIDNPTGMQDSEMKGWKKDGDPYEGVTMFASGYDKTRDDYGRYWNEYEDKIDLSHSNSLVGEYVSNYVNKLNNTYGVSATGTLIAKSEIESIVGTTLEDGDKLSEIEGVPSWLYSTTYWTRSANYDEIVFEVDSYGYFGGIHFNYKNYYGVRPVITISSSLLK